MRFNVEMTDTFAERTDCFAVIMPMRAQSEITPWAVARSIA